MPTTSLSTSPNTTNPLFYGYLGSKQPSQQFDLLINCSKPELIRRFDIPVYQIDVMLSCASGGPLVDSGALYPFRNDPQTCLSKDVCSKKVSNAILRNLLEFNCPKEASEHNLKYCKEDNSLLMEVDSSLVYLKSKSGPKNTLMEQLIYSTVATTKSCIKSLSADQCESYNSFSKIILYQGCLNHHYFDLHERFSLLDGIICDQALNATGEVPSNSSVTTCEYMDTKGKQRILPLFLYQNTSIFNKYIEWKDEGKFSKYAGSGKPAFNNKEFISHVDNIVTKVKDLWNKQC